MFVNQVFTKGSSKGALSMGKEPLPILITGYIRGAGLTVYCQASVFLLGLMGIDTRESI